MLDQEPDEDEDAYPMDEIDIQFVYLYQQMFSGAFPPPFDFRLH